ncbi:pirin family protein [Bacillus sp. 2205SS5-2]|uniref:pirin family protein n=1 Tax=Bacillus sp. 2205SS5-2 TaxID=3109031 RepID=UPI0030061009
MLTIYRADERFTANHGWLHSRFSFSFADYYDPNNMNFGPMRVLNDDIVEPLRGFGSHPHKEMEIVSIVLEGQLKHEDSTGESAVTSFGGIQRMTAGTGVIHSEMNPSKKEAVNFLQMWFLPEKSGLAPSYEKSEFDYRKLKNNLLPVVSSAHKGDQVAHIHQDLTIYLSDLNRNQKLSFSQKEDRNTFIFVIKGELDIDGENLQTRDSARITMQTEVNMIATQDVRFMLIDLPRS